MAVVLEPETPTREQVRSRRKREVRKVTINVSRLTQRELNLGRELYPEDTAPERPRTRGECVDGLRPCPFVSCVHHLFLDVQRNGHITLNFPDLGPDELDESCALDVADRGGATLESVGALMNLTRERIRQVEVKAIARVKPRIRHLSETDADGRRHLPIVLPERTNARRERPLMTQTQSDPYSATAIEAECARLTAHIEALQVENANCSALVEGFTRPSDGDR